MGAKQSKSNASARAGRQQGKKERVRAGDAAEGSLHFRCIVSGRTLSEMSLPLQVVLSASQTVWPINQSERASGNKKNWHLAQALAR